MTLREYLKQTGTSRAQLAEQIGVSVESIRRYLNGRVPERVVMESIITATDGKVTANDFFGIAA